jgi:hypothetical protein
MLVGVQLAYSPGLQYAFAERGQSAESMMHGRRRS